MSKQVKRRIWVSARLDAGLLHVEIAPSTQKYNQSFNSFAVINSNTKSYDLK